MFFILAVKVDKILELSTYKMPFAKEFAYFETIFAYFESSGPAKADEKQIILQIHGR